MEVELGRLEKQQAAEEELLQKRNSKLSGNLGRLSMHKEMPNIIICEDDAITSESLKLSLKKNGYDNISTVKSGEALIELAVKTKTSLIISDITLSGDLDGIEAISRISRIKNIPYIFITGHPDYLTLIESYNLHPSMVYIKPLDISQLISNIQDILPRYNSNESNKMN